MEEQREVLARRLVVQAVGGGRADRGDLSRVSIGAIIQGHVIPSGLHLCRFQRRPIAAHLVDLKIDADEGVVGRGLDEIPAVEIVVVFVRKIRGLYRSLAS